MALESWELIIFNLAVGSLLGGFLLFFFSIFTAGFHFGHGGHSTHTGHLSHFGHWFHIPHFGHFGHFLHMGHASHTHIHTQHGAKFDQNPSTPILLIFSAFLLMFGAIGTVIYQMDFNPLLRILLVITIPLVFVKLVSILWNKLVSYESGYEIPTVSIDNQVKTLTVVDEKGGLVLAETGDLDEPNSHRLDEQIKMFARTLPGVSIERDNTAYVIDIDQKNTLIIDFWPRIAKKERNSNEIETN